MKRQTGHVFSILLLAIVPQLALSGEAQVSAVPAQEIDRLLAPIALYPDAMLAQVLTAVTHPEDVAAAARWLERNRALRGERALQAALAMPWDASVVSLIPFPDLIRRLELEAEWASKTAAVFLGAEPDLLDSVQRLRRLALGSGALPERLRAERQGLDVRIEAGDRSRPVPDYDPAEVFRPWPWTSPPVRLKVMRSAEHSSGMPFRFAEGLLFAGFDWAARHTHVVSLRLEASVPGLQRPEEHREKPASEVTPVVNAVAVRPPPLVQLGVAPEPAAPSRALLLGASPVSPPPGTQPAPSKVPALVALGRPNASSIALPPFGLPPGPSAGKADVDAAPRPARDPVPVSSAGVSPAEKVLSAPLASGAFGAGVVNPRTTVAREGHQDPAVSMTHPVKRFRAFISEADRRTLEGLK